MYIWQQSHPLVTPTFESKGDVCSVVTVAAEGGVQTVGVSVIWLWPPSGSIILAQLTLQLSHPGLQLSHMLLCVCITGSSQVDAGHHKAVCGAAVHVSSLQWEHKEAEAGGQCQPAVAHGEHTHSGHSVCGTGTRGSEGTAQELPLTWEWQA